MTTKPKAKRFRIRRRSQDGGDAKAQASTPGADAGMDAAARPTGGGATARTEDGFGSEPFATARAGAPAATQSEAVAAEIEAIRNEGLTGRQLRMARRLAHKHGLASTSDFDAVRLLRKAGIDPFERANMLELVVADPKAKAKSGGALTAPGPGTEVSTEVRPPETSRFKEVQEIQADIARRRRQRIYSLAIRLAGFVLLPTVLVGFYYTQIATPMYATKSEFVIQQADQGGGAGMGGLLSGTGLATSQDSITVQSYLQSREALLRLDEDLGYKSHFAGTNIDFLQRLDPDATNEEAYKTFRRNVKIGYDPTEGIVRMEVIAASPQESAAFSRALIGYAEEQVDNLTQRLREDQMQGANETFAEAEEKMEAAQLRVLELQQDLGVLDPTTETSALMGQITQFETQIAEKRLQLQQLLDNPAPNQARVSGVEGDIERLQTLVTELRAELTEENDAGGSMASMTAQLRMAEVDLETRTMMMQEALQSLETARTEANRQVRYLSLGVNPIPPDEASYPRAFENTVLAFLIFSGIYLMGSLTASILREQMSG
ncbi:MAG: capsule biosynthesis protein [Pseudomonadota bacterium]